jgi:hypothetical protein
MIDPRFPSVWCGGEIAPLPALQFVAFVTSILVLAQMKNFFFNSLAAIDGHDHQYFNELRSTVVSRRIFIRSQSLIAR